MTTSILISLLALSSFRLILSSTPPSPPTQSPSTQTSASETVFTPQLSDSCGYDLAQFVYALQPSGGCGTIMANVLGKQDNFTSCSSGVGGVDCFSYNSFVSAADNSQYLVPSYFVPANLTDCGLCSEEDGMYPACATLLDAVVNVTYNASVDYFGTFGVTSPATITSLKTLAKAAGGACSSQSDLTSIQVLRYQSQVVCASQQTFNYTLSSYRTIQGVLDLRAMPQCGTCAIIPCLPGQLCDGNGAAILCPEGYYCPTTTAKITCPKGYFCPQGSTSPTACSSLSGGSCNSEGLEREVIWIPLLIAMLLFGLILVSPMFYPCVELMLIADSNITHPAASSSDPINKGYLAANKQIPVQRAAPEISFSTISSPVSIAFSGIKLVTGKTVRISGVDGYIRPGKFTAIIGGSGAGKTSLMNVILGREDRTAGEIAYLALDQQTTPASRAEAGLQAPIMINPELKQHQKKITSSILSRIVAFVPQNDVYLREMTVYELIAHSARWRLPSSFTAEKIHQRIEEVIDSLQLSHLRHVQVGGMGGLGTALSPGDKKKVNIALELVAGPNVLFLDEPTTGIDSTSALNVASIVHRLAKTGLTCVAVIHQPRSEIFSLIDDLIILIRGGYVAYQGPTEYVLQYFLMYGLQPEDPIKDNKTDFLIDLVSKSPPSEVIQAFLHGSSAGSGAGVATAGSGPAYAAATAAATSNNNHNNNNNNLEVTASLVMPDSQQTAAGHANQVPPSITWADLWTRDGEAFMQRMTQQQQQQTVFDPFRSFGAAQQQQATSNNAELPSGGSLKMTSTKTFVPLDVPRPGFLRQLLLFCQRGFLQHFKNAVCWNDLFMHFLAGIIMGIATCGGPLLVGLIPSTYVGSCPPGGEVKCNAWIRFEVGPATFVMTMILGAVTVPIAVRTFGREKEVFAREAAVGANQFAYFLGKQLADFLFTAINTFMYLAPIFAIAPWQAPPSLMYGVLLCISFTVSSMGYFMSFLFQNPDDAVLTGVIFAILLNLFSGFVPTIGDGVIGQIMYTHWAARAIVAVELINGEGLTEATFNQIVTSNWQNPDLGQACGLMILIGVLMRVVSLGCLYWNNRQSGKIG